MKDLEKDVIEMENDEPIIEVMETKVTVNKRSTPEKKNGNIVEVLKPRTMVKVVGFENGWAELEDGCFIMDDYLE